MNVASLELCRELYGLSGWADASFYYYRDDKSGVAGIKQWHVQVDPTKEFVNHAYDLGYLLRKLAEVESVGIQFNHPDHRTALMPDRWMGKYVAYTVWMPQGGYPVADTPEDAACKLAIELFKQGILTKESA